ncbi:hypothetical protein [Maritimibacter sp. HL-12]|uniref:hypothetical protein n=1 Tax=Maritimibacter sp. HL-12 TaxID=1162418 RepID=UPI000A0F306C|nr:hypothetical protein [Maritimibacter sp. HL-12]SMH51152.1 hypothetical protein SAMN05661107_2445 [Maritimibacter sp. HL-12]
MWTFVGIFLLVAAALLILSLRPVQVFLFNAMIIWVFLFVTSLISLFIWLAVFGSG